MKNGLYQEFESIAKGDITPKNAFYRYCNDIAQTGAIGILANLISSGIYGSGADFLAGPTVGELGELIEKSVQDARAFSKMKSWKQSQLLKMAFRRIPLFGRVFANRIFKRKKKNALLKSQNSDFKRELNKIKGK